MRELPEVMETPSETSFSIDERYQEEFEERILQDNEVSANAIFEFLKKKYESKKKSPSTKLSLNMYGTRIRPEKLIEAESQLRDDLNMKDSSFPMIIRSNHDIDEFNIFLDLIPNKKLFFEYLKTRTLNKQGKSNVSYKPYREDLNRIDLVIKELLAKGELSDEEKEVYDKFLNDLSKNYIFLEPYTPELLARNARQSENPRDNLGRLIDKFRLIRYEDYEVGVKSTDGNYDYSDTIKAAEELLQRNSEISGFPRLVTVFRDNCRPFIICIECPYDKDRIFESLPDLSKESREKIEEICSDHTGSGDGNLIEDILKTPEQNGEEQGN